MRWFDCQVTYQHRDFWGGGFADAIREFIARWEARPSPREKILLIDRLIHVWIGNSAKSLAWAARRRRFSSEGSRKEVIGRWWR